MVSGELQIIEDIVRTTHLATLAMCFLLVLIADLTAVKSAFRPLGKHDFNRLDVNHAALTSALIVLWLTGLFLIWRATTFDATQFSPKLVAKFIVITVLTVNAVIIGRFALPFFKRNKGKVFGEFRFSTRFRLGCCAALSSASWISAFCLGAFPWLKTASPAELIDFVTTIYVFCFIVTSLVAMVSGREKTQVDVTNLSPLLLGTSRRLSETSVFAR